MCTAFPKYFCFLSIENSTMGSFFLWVLVSVLAFFFSKEMYCSIQEKWEELVEEGAIASWPPSSLQSPFDVFHKLLYKVKSPQGTSIFGYLAADKQRKHFRHLFWMIQCRDFRRCSPFGKFPVFSPLLLAVIDEEKKADWRGRTLYISWLWEGESLNKSL